MDILKGAYALGKYKKIINHKSPGPFKGKLTYLKEGERVEFTNEQLEEIKIKAEYLIENDLDGETFWADNEIYGLAELIEIKEDDGEDASQLRAYRKNIRAYLVDENFPTCERPTL